MSRVLRHTIYIDRDPNDIFKGWAWIEIAIEDAKRFEIPLQGPASRQQIHSLSYEQRRKLPNNGNLPSKGKAGRKQFLLLLGSEVVPIKTQKFVTINALCAWLRTWASPEATLMSPGKRLHTLNGAILTHRAHFVYFIFNSDSQAIKIGRASDLTKRLKSLQTGSPVPLQLLATVQLEGYQQAKHLESQLHQKFDDIRIQGEWFRAEPELLEYIEALS